MRKLMVWLGFCNPPGRVTYRRMYGAVHPDYPHLIGYGETKADAYCSLVNVIDGLKEIGKAYGSGSVD